jgi:hypothetical protein
MFKVSHTTLIVISGFIWLIIGCTLLTLGLNFVVESILKANLTLFSRPILDRVAPYMDGVESAALVWIAICLFVGFMKARYIFSKTVQKGVERIQSLSNPASIRQIYTKKYYILLGSMIFLGLLVKFLPLDIRGGIDIIIGSALINGAMQYFRNAFLNAYRFKNSKFKESVQR